MSVAVQYPFPGMHSPTTASSKPVLPPSYHSPRDFEKLAAMQAQVQPPYSNGGGRPSTSSKFDSHDDFYDFLDSNRGGSGGPPNSAAAMQQQQQQGGSPNMQRGPVPINGPDQSRPPVTRGAGGAQMRSRPPPTAAAAARPCWGPQAGRRPSLPQWRPPSAAWRAGSGAQSQSQQQQSSSQNARPTSSDSASSAEGNQARPLARTNTAAGAALGAAIQRLKSPSVMDCVLSPLESKVTEYLGFMTAEEDDIARLDKEIAQLQARKAEAEARHAEFKAKHDDYRRHNGPPTTRELQQQQAAAQAAQAAQGGMGRPSVHNPQHDGRHMDDDDMDEDDYDDEDEYQQRRPASRRIMSQQSFGRSSQQGKKSRFRFSLFGGDK
ncbi:hypothetical protein PG997_002063 [Apiospora hydei]|uniref:Uncharacterized protein n=1 Tax=Apiospora hydei TaxID=1337664 RepID=A0ABR1X853_9PEZI